MHVSDFQHCKIFPQCANFASTKLANWILWFQAVKLSEDAEALVVLHAIPLCLVPNVSICCGKHIYLWHIAQFRLMRRWAIRSKCAAMQGALP